MTPILFKVKAKPNIAWLDKELAPKDNEVYSVIVKRDRYSKLWNSLRTFITILELKTDKGYYEYDLGGFDIIDLNINLYGERAPQHNIPSQGKDIVPIAEYKFNHIF